MTLYIMQGVPGSGKSTLAQIICRQIDDNIRNCRICSTDSYFYVDDEYKFDPSKLKEYHQKNLGTAKIYLNCGYDVIVDNTNIQRWECKPYVEHAHKLNIPVVFIRVNGNFESTHGVPKEKIEQMRSKMEDLTLESVLST